MVPWCRGILVVPGRRGLALGPAVRGRGDCRAPPSERGQAAHCSHVSGTTGFLPRPLPLPPCTAAGGQSPGRARCQLWPPGLCARLALHHLGLCKHFSLGQGPPPQPPGLPSVRGSRAAVTNARRLGCNSGNVSSFRSGPEPRPRRSWRRTGLPREAPGGSLLLLPSPGVPGAPGLGATRLLSLPPSAHGLSSASVSLPFCPLQGRLSLDLGPPRSRVGPSRDPWLDGVCRDPSSKQGHLTHPGTRWAAGAVFLGFVRSRLMAEAGSGAWTLGPGCGSWEAKESPGGKPPALQGPSDLCPHGSAEGRAGVLASSSSPQPSGSSPQVQGVGWLPQQACCRRVALVLGGRLPRKDCPPTPFFSSWRHHL